MNRIREAEGLSDIGCKVTPHTGDSLRFIAWCAFHIFVHRCHNRASGLFRGVSISQGGL